MKIVPRIVSTFLSALCGGLALTVFQVHITVCIVAVRNFRRIFSLRSVWYPVYFFCLAGFRLSRNSNFPIFWTISKDARRCRAEDRPDFPPSTNREQTGKSRRWKKLLPNLKSRGRHSAPKERPFFSPRSRSSTKDRQ